MNIKLKIFVILTSVILLSATALAATESNSKVGAILKAEAPVAAFTAHPTSGYAPLKVAFTDESKGVHNSYKWNFGDGKTSTEKNPEHTYINVGNYTVILTVRNSAGNNTTVKSNYIIVKPLKAPVANFTAHPTSGDASLNVKFTDESTGVHNLWKWSFGDGTYSIVQNPEHRYAKPGNYTVSLTVGNAAGNNTATKLNFIVVKPLKAPVANFTAHPTSGKEPLNVAFIDKSTGVLNSWKWSFGDGTFSTFKNPVHKYTKAGNYTVSLTVGNAAGNNTKTISNFIKVTSK